MSTKIFGSRKALLEKLKNIFFNGLQRPVSSSISSPNLFPIVSNKNFSTINGGWCREGNLSCTHSSKCEYNTNVIGTIFTQE